MSDIAIRVDNLSKRYRIGAREEGANTLRERLGRLAASPFDYLRRQIQGPSEEEIIWALKDVSFEVKHGEVLGIIGRNGAGKSTLLKVLSRITEPTEGEAIINGRVGSLLEVGTGFHPELTGRENVYLNGAILGMKRDEIDAKFDEIVAFSGVEKFIDTPVKRYSSGMRVRLAFSVAAHLDPEILLIDEVLAVGDAAFQKKCLGKMGDVAKGGRTVLFVSHDMSAIDHLCPRVLWIESGRIEADGASSSVVTSYLSTLHLSTETTLDGRTEWPQGLVQESNSEFALKSIILLKTDGQIGSVFRKDEPITVRIEYEVRRCLFKCRVGYVLSNGKGMELFETYDVDNPECSSTRNTGTHVSRSVIPADILRPGVYSLSINAGMRGHKNLLNAQDVLRFEVSSAGSGEYLLKGRRTGVVAPLIRWSIDGRNEGEW